MSLPSKFSTLSIRNKIIIYSLIFLVPIFILFAYTGEYYTKKAIYENTIDKAKTEAAKAAGKIENFNLTISQEPKKIAVLAGFDIKKGLEDSKNIIKNEIKKNSSIYGMAIAFLPKYSPDKNYFCDYYYKKNNRIMYKKLVPPAYNYTKFDWFKKPIQIKKDVWSGAYFDKGGGEIWMSTYSALIKNKNGEIIGVATADISLSYLSHIVEQIKLLKTGKAFIISDKGDILAPTSEKTTNKGNLSVVFDNFHNKKFQNIIQDMKNRKTGHKNFILNKKEYFIFYMPIKETNLNIGFIFDAEEMLSPVLQLHKYYIMISLLGILIFMILTMFITKRVTKDILEVKKISDKIANGNFETPIPLHLTAEAKDVANALKKMQDSLKEYIKKVEHTAKIENEIEYAKKIQQTFIPQKMETKINSIEFAACSYWAKQVGGDFYGISELDNSRTMFYLGDVSGKGIPAALYVAIVKSMLENVVKNIQSPKIVMELLNNYLANISKQYTFATAFMGIIDYKNNKLTYCNAGHNPPIIFSRNEFMSTLISPKDIPLGAFENYQYKEKTYPLDKIDGMFVYSDGLTDAINNKNEIFGMDSVLDILKSNYNAKPQKTIDIIINTQNNFIKNIELYDDTTLLLWKKSV